MPHLPSQKFLNGERNRKMLTVKFRIDGQDDRRTLVSILADNGYKCVIEKKDVFPMGENYFVVVELKNHREEIKS